MKFAACHPDQPHIAKGLCKVCYNRRRNATGKTPERRASKQRSNVEWRKTLKGRTYTLFAQARTNVNGLPFDLTIEDVVIPSHCPILGIPLDCAAKRPADNLPSLDRIDNTKGYVKGNVWVISWRANFLKGDASLPELQALVHALELRTSGKVSGS